MHSLYALIDGTTGLGREGPDLTRYIAVCGLLALTLAGLAFGFRKLFSGAIQARAAARSLRVVDVLPLGGKRQLSVVRVYDRTFVLGLSEREVNLVAELDPSDLPEALDPSAQAALAEAQREAFAQVLARAKQRVGVEPRGPGTAPGSARARVDTLVDDELEVLS